MDLKYLLFNRELQTNVGPFIQKAVHTGKEQQSFFDQDFSDLCSNIASISTIKVKFSPCGKYIASTHGDHTVKVFDTCTKQLIRCFEGHLRTPWTVAFHPHFSHLLASGDINGDVFVWSLHQSQPLYSSCYPSRKIFCVCFHPKVDEIALAVLVCAQWSQSHPFLTSCVDLISFPVELSVPFAVPVPRNSIVPTTALKTHTPCRGILFHPLGHMLVTIEISLQARDSRCTSVVLRQPETEPPVPRRSVTRPREDQCSTLINIWAFPLHSQCHDKPLLSFPLCEAYSENGVSFSPDGTSIAFFFKNSLTPSSIKLVSLAPPALGKVIATIPLKTPTIAQPLVTCLAFSASGSHILVAYTNDNRFVRETRQSQGAVPILVAFRVLHDLSPHPRLTSPLSPHTHTRSSGRGGAHLLPLQTTMASLPPRPSTAPTEADMDNPDLSQSRKRLKAMVSLHPPPAPSFVCMHQNSFFRGAAVPCECLSPLHSSTPTLLSPPANLSSFALSLSPAQAPSLPPPSTQTPSLPLPQQPPKKRKRNRALQQQPESSPLLNKYCVCYWTAPQAASNSLDISKTDNACIVFGTKHGGLMMTSPSTTDSEDSAESIPPSSLTDPLADDYRELHVVGRGLSRLSSPTPENTLYPIHTHPCDTVHFDRNNPFFCRFCSHTLHSILDENPTPRLDAVPSLPEPSEFFLF
eukprot:GCRY01004657.1.p1 GENE.GCRY01004657.1~~GCRY01004657.1.p1  ORF type:complete len:692 (+),score=74.91 GCRY01004657.1:35-2110(+)